MSDGECFGKEIILETPIRDPYRIRIENKAKAGRGRLAQRESIHFSIQRSEFSSNGISFAPMAILNVQLDFSKMYLAA